MPLNLETVLRRQPGAEDSAINGEVVVLDSEGKMVRALNGSAARVWQLLDGRRSVREICRAIASEFDASTEEIEVDVIAFLKDLCRTQLAVGETE